MAYRTFIDRFGAYWQVWDVRPDRAERRSLERRRHGVEWKGHERRVGQRRHLIERRTVVNSGKASGWLVFESPREKRCLNPIPDNWEKMSQEELRCLWEKASPMPTNGNGHTTVA